MQAIFPLVRLHYVPLNRCKARRNVYFYIDKKPISIILTGSFDSEDRMSQRKVNLSLHVPLEQQTSRSFISAESRCILNTELVIPVSEFKAEV